MGPFPVKLAPDQHVDSQCQPGGEKGYSCPYVPANQSMHGPFSPPSASFIFLLDDQGSDHPKHPVLRLCMGKDVAVEGPGAGVIAVDDHVPALARSDVEGVTLPGSRLRP